MVHSVGGVNLVLTWPERLTSMYISVPKVIFLQAAEFSDEQCWTEGRISTATAEYLRPTAMATVAEVWGHSYGQRSYVYFS